MAIDTENRVYESNTCGFHMNITVEPANYVFLLPLPSGHITEFIMGSASLRGSLFSQDKADHMLSFEMFSGKCMSRWQQSFRNDSRMKQLDL